MSGFRDRDFFVLGLVKQSRGNIIARGGPARRSDAAAQVGQRMRNKVLGNLLYVAMLKGALTPLKKN